MIKSPSANLKTRKHHLVTFANFDRQSQDPSENTRPNKQFSLKFRVKTEQGNGLILNKLSTSPDLDDKAKMEIIIEKMNVIKSQMQQGKVQCNIFDKPKLSAIITRIDQPSQLPDAFQSRSETPKLQEQKQKSSFKFGDMKKRAQSDYEDLTNRLRELSHKKQQIIQDMNQHIRRSQPAVDEHIVNKSSKQTPKDLNKTNKTNEQIRDQTVLTKTSYSKSILSQLQSKVNKRCKENQLKPKHSSQEKVKPEFQGIFEGFGKMTNIYYKPMKASLLDILGDVCISQELANWTSYEGQVKNNLFHGHGVLIVDQKYRIQGEFINGKAEGKVSIISINRLSEGIVADFENGMLERVHPRSKSQIYDDII